MSTDDSANPPTPPDASDPIGPLVAASRSSYRPGELAGLMPAHIGRETQIQQLLECFYSMIEDDQAQLAIIVGDQGVGKSRLAYEFRQLMARLPEPAQYFWLSADPQRSAQPYGLIRAIVMGFFRIRENDPPAHVHAALEYGLTRLLNAPTHEQAHIIGQILGFDFADSPFIRDRIHDLQWLREHAFAHSVEAMRRVAAYSPMVIQIDDMQFADEGSLDVIKYWMSESSGLQVMLLLTSRPSFFMHHPTWFSEVPGAVRIDLGALDERDSRRLLGDMLRKAGKLPSDLRNLIVSRAEGNPLFMEELIKMLINDEVILPGPEVWQVQAGRLSRLRVPANLSDLLLARVQARSPIERSLLERGAVIGRTFWLGALAACPDAPDRDTIAHAANRLEQRELIVRAAASRFAGEDEFAFRHAVLHEVIYERVNAEQKRQCHAAAAAWLLAQSGERADEWSALIAEHFERAENPELAAKWFERAADHARASSAPEDALGHLRRALNLFGSDTPIAKIQTLRKIGELLIELSRLNEALGVFNQMRDQAELVGDLIGQAQAWGAISRAYDNLTEPQLSHESAARALAIARQSGDLATIFREVIRHGWQLLRVEQSREALVYGDEALQLAQQTGAPAHLADAYGMIGSAQEGLEQFEEAEGNLRKALEIYRSLNQRNEITTLLNNLGVMINAQGNWEEANRVLQEALQISREVGLRLNEIYSLSNIVIAQIGLEQYAEAEKNARLGIRLSENSRMTVFSDFYRALAEAQLGRGHVAEAVESAQAALEAARKAESPREIGVAWRVLGMAISQLEDPMGAPPCFAESARLLATASQGELARTLREWARHEIHHNDKIRGRARWLEARELFTHVGLHLEATRMSEFPTD